MLPNSLPKWYFGDGELSEDNHIKVIGEIVYQSVFIKNCIIDKIYIYAIIKIINTYDYERI